MLTDLLLMLFTCAVAALLVVGGAYAIGVVPL